MLKLRNISAHAAGKEILRGVDVHFEKGKVYALMGPNGSGKTTLARAVMGHPEISLSEGSEVFFEGENITGMRPEERARRGVFMSFQSPLSLSGITATELLQYALGGRKDAVGVAARVGEVAAQLGIADEFLARSLNDGFSGGERKKMEVLQAAVLEPKLMFFDEIDTGVDVDALRTIAGFIARFKTPEQTVVLVTHYKRLLEHIVPDAVFVMKGGRIAASGGRELVETIEKKGYDAI